jgi:hypothetical protein
MRVMHAYGVCVCVACACEHACTHVYVCVCVYVWRGAYVFACPAFACIRSVFNILAIYLPVRMQEGLYGLSQMARYTSIGGLLVSPQCSLPLHLPRRVLKVELLTGNDQDHTWVEYADCKATPPGSAADAMTDAVQSSHRGKSLMVLWARKGVLPVTDNPAVRHLNR